MSALPIASHIFCALPASSVSLFAAVGSPRVVSMPQALLCAPAANPRLTPAERDIRSAGGVRIWVGTLPNLEASFELDNALGSSPYKGFRSAETSLQLSQLVELEGNREARVEAAIRTAVWQRRATRLAVPSETAIAFMTIVSAQRRIEIFDDQIASFDPSIPLFQKRVQERVSLPAETLPAQVAADVFRVERERVKTRLATARLDLTIPTGESSPRFGEAVGRQANVGRPPPFKAIVQAIEPNPQLMRWTAVSAQRNAELVIARLKAVMDARVSARWRHFQEANDNPVRLGASLPVFHQNTGNIIAAPVALAKADRERTINKLVLTSIVGRAKDTPTGAFAEIKLLRSSVIPNARSVAETAQLQNTREI